MPDLNDFFFDASFVEEVIGYLEAAHSIQALVVDRGGRPLSLRKAGVVSVGVSRLFPLEHSSEVGGLLCIAESEACLDRAEPHIAICIKAVNHLLQREMELQQAGDEMLALSEQLHFLFRLAGRIIGNPTLQELCTVILQDVGAAIDADYGLVRTSGFRREQVDINWQLTAARSSELEALGFLHREAAERTLIFSLADGTSTLISPIRGKEGTSGCIAFFRNGGRRPFTAYQKKLVSIIENIYSPTIETIRLYNSLQELYLNTVKALAAAIDAKDEHTHGHSFRVARYAKAIGIKMGISHSRLAELEIAAYMHDLGKIGIPEAILAKPGKLTPEEFSQIKKHPIFTDKILQPINLAESIVDAAVHHHERLDGSGYPHGLRGEQISSFARIIAVADVFDALTSERPYRPAMSVEDSLETLCQGVDDKFDRLAVTSLVSALDDEKPGSLLADHKLKLEFTKIDHFNRFLHELFENLLTDKGGSSPPSRSPVY